MKTRLFVILIGLVLAVCSLDAQNRFDKIAEMEGVTSVYVSPKMFNMMKDSNSSTGDINIDKVAKNLRDCKSLQLKIRKLLRRSEKKQLLLTLKMVTKN